MTSATRNRVAHVTPHDATRPRRSFTRRRRGLSLMEVIFSVGVIVTGLLGVAILVPAAGRLAAKGNMLDQAARAGVCWVRDFEVRGYAQPGAWVLGDAPSTPAYVNDVNPMTGAVITYAYEKSFCIDSRFAAVNGDTYFPYVAGITDPRMRRITIRSGPGAAKLTLDQADELFIAHDDLNLDRPIDATQLPVQVYGQAGGGKRQSDDRISYLATLVPKLQGGNLPRDLYTLSIVVLKNRDPSMTMVGKVPPKHDNERLVDVAQFYGASGGGGDVQVGDIQLRARSGRTAAEAQADLTVHRSDWLMLGGSTIPYNQTTVMQVFRWYRVVHSSDPQLNGSGQWVVDVTLHGPDWNSGIAAQATILTDVVAVYEKTLHLENSSLWVR